VPATFFAISPIRTGDFPPLPMGTLGYPGFAWPAIEFAKDQYDFSIYDSYVDQAVAAGLYDPATHTVELSMTLGLTPAWALANDSTCTRPSANGGENCTAPPDSLRFWSSLLDTLVGHSTA